MDFKTCKFCRKSFRGFSALCPACVEQLDSKYLAVRNYLDKNTEANISRVAEETGVDDRSLLFLIREGRITLRGESSAIKCLKCGAEVFSGKYCDKCKDGLVRQLQTTKSSMESSLRPAQQKDQQATESKNRMHILKD